MNIIAYTGEGLQADAGAAELLADVEGMVNHARSIAARRPGAGQRDKGV
jgi:histidinol dehydrogenase